MKDGREDGIQRLRQQPTVIKQQPNNQTAIQQSITTQNSTKTIMAAHQSRMTAFEKQIEKYLRGASDLSPGEMKESILEMANKVFSRKSKAKSDGPKKPANAYILFTNENRTVIVQELLDENGEKPSAGQVTKRAGQKWKALGKDGQAPYVEKRAELMARFEEEHPELVTSARSSTPRSAFEFDKTDPTELTVPEGWSKVFKGKYLRKNADGIKAGVGKFATLAEAIKASEKMGSESGGVTLTSRGFFVRKSNDPVTESNKSKRGTTFSWVKEDFEVPDEKPKVKKPKVKKAKTPEPEPESDESHVEVPMCGAPAPVSNTSPYDDDTDDESDDESDDEAGMFTWEHKSVTYLIDNEDDDECDVIDFATQEKIGRRVKKGNGKWKIVKN